MLHVDTYRSLKQNIIIKECNEEMVEIPSFFPRFSPHPYLHVDAPYGDVSPYYLRSGVLDRLHVAREKLYELKSGYKLKIFDAYRPIEVQKYMIEYDTKRYSKKIAQMYWSPISDDIYLNPPPHSTGAALDLTIVDEQGIELDMGTKIDEFTKLSHSDALDNKNRDLLLDVMTYAGFTRLPTEWWHFSYGDQIWAIENNSDAKYGII